MKINLNIDKEIGAAFRRYVFDKYGTTYRSGTVLEEAIVEFLNKEGVFNNQISKPTFLNAYLKEVKKARVKTSKED